MIQAVNMLEIRQKLGEIVDRALYRKDRFIIKRKNKPVAALIPLEDYALFIGDESGIEIYSKKRIQEFAKNDLLGKDEQSIIEKLLSN